MQLIKTTNNQYLIKQTKLAIIDKLGKLEVISVKIDQTNSKINRDFIYLPI